VRRHSPVSYLNWVNEFGVFNEHVVDDEAHDHACHSWKVPKLAHVQEHIVWVYILSANIQYCLPVQAASIMIIGVSFSRRDHYVLNCPFLNNMRFNFHVYLAEYFRFQYEFFKSVETSCLICKVVATNDIERILKMNYV
jgi:hypothetical protein